MHYNQQQARERELLGKEKTLFTVRRSSSGFPLSTSLNNQRRHLVTSHQSSPPCTVANWFRSSTMENENQDIGGFQATTEFTDEDFSKLTDIINLTTTNNIEGISEFYERFNSTTILGERPELVRVVKASTQVVCGAKYHLTVETINDTRTKKFYRVVFVDQPWLKRVVDLHVDPLPDNLEAY